MSLDILFEVEPKFYGKSMKKLRTYAAHCVCGNITFVTDASLRAGTSSCGCLRKVMLTKRNTKHGMSKLPAYSSWQNMMSRCYGFGHKNLSEYKGRGIYVCDRWHNFLNFLEDMGERPDGMSIDRIDPDGIYCKENCRWADNETQQNNKRVCAYYNYHGEKKTVAQIARAEGVSYSVARNLAKKMDKYK